MCEGINVLSHLNSATLNYFPVPITILRQVRRSSEEARSYPGYLFGNGRFVFGEVLLWRLRDVKYKTKEKFV